ncbi:polyadp-ribose glycohydrolase [Fusarium sporotrichioides]|uniref:poly(ADP-ribose) glycohydrolase n=1 Tax=Fusarium sporotrichioides TaxID=5514 RepID=A0A395RNB2_FUSSP|nr:polyadp-ribose glycohydrolase [Fusarium sporotrichioides]
MSSRPPSFLLPNSSSCRVLDRFSDLPDDIQVEEDNEGKVPSWPLLHHLISTPVLSIAQLIDRLQTIASNAETCQDGDHGFLKKFLQDRGKSKILDITWPKIRDIALDLPAYFPSGQLALLRSDSPLRLSRGQVACLVAHQFLCSSVPQRNDDGYQDLGIWYSSEQRHPTAVQMYLEALFIYFEDLPAAKDLLDDHQAGSYETHNLVSYELHQTSQVSLANAKLGPVQVRYTDIHTSDAHHPHVQGKGGAVVVSSNKVIGFGQSATQEEIFVGIAPEAYPVVLVAPHLADNTVITVSGARAMVDVRGQRRNIEWKTRPVSSLNEDQKSWQGGRLVFMDALEMDMAERSSSDDLPDLYPENVDREVSKAINGFTSYKGDSVFTGLWGCGAFGGDPGVKLIVLWLAAGASNVELKMVLGSGEHHLGKGLEDVVKACGGLTANDVRVMLLRVPKELRREGILEWITGEASRVSQHQTI